MIIHVHLMTSCHYCVPAVFFQRADFSALNASLSIFSHCYYSLYTVLTNASQVSLMQRKVSIAPS